MLLTRSPCFSRWAAEDVNLRSTVGRMAVLQGSGDASVHVPGCLRAIFSDPVMTNSRNPRHFDTIEGGRVYQALHIDSKSGCASVLDALRRVKKCFRHST